MIVTLESWRGWWKFDRKGVQKKLREHEEWQEETHRRNCVLRDILNIEHPEIRVVFALGENDDVLGDLIALHRARLNSPDPPFVPVARDGDLFVRSGCWNVKVLCPKTKDLLSMEKALTAVATDSLPHLQPRDLGHAVSAMARITGCDVTKGKSCISVTKPTFDIETIRSWQDAKPDACGSFTEAILGKVKVANGELARTQLRELEHLAYEMPAFFRIVMGGGRVVQNAIVRAVFVAIQQLDDNTGRWPRQQGAAGSLDHDVREELTSVFRKREEYAEDFERQGDEVSSIDEATAIENLVEAVMEVYIIPHNVDRKSFLEHLRSEEFCATIDRQYAGKQMAPDDYSEFKAVLIPPYSWQQDIFEGRRFPTFPWRRSQAHRLASDSVDIAMVDRLWRMQERYPVTRKILTWLAEWTESISRGRLGNWSTCIGGDVGAVFPATLSFLVELCETTDVEKQKKNVAKFIRLHAEAEWAKDAIGVVRGIRAAILADLDEESDKDDFNAAWGELGIDHLPYNLFPRSGAALLERLEIPASPELLENDPVIAWLATLEGVWSRQSPHVPFKAWFEQTDVRAFLPGLPSWARMSKLQPLYEAGWLHRGTTYPWAYTGVEERLRSGVTSAVEGTGWEGQDAFDRMLQAMQNNMHRDAATLNYMGRLSPTVPTDDLVNWIRRFVELCPDPDGLQTLRFTWMNCGIEVFRNMHAPERGRDVVTAFIHQIADEYKAPSELVNSWEVATILVRQPELQDFGRLIQVVGPFPALRNAVINNCKRLCSGMHSVSGIGGRSQPMPTLLLTVLEWEKATAWVWDQQLTLSAAAAIYLCFLADGLSKEASTPLLHGNNSLHREAALRFCAQGTAFTRWLSRHTGFHVAEEWLDVVDGVMGNVGSRKKIQQQLATVHAAEAAAACWDLRLVNLLSAECYGLSIKFADCTRMDAVDLLCLLIHCTRGVALHGAIINARVRECAERFGEKKRLLWWLHPVKRTLVSTDKANKRKDEVSEELHLALTEAQQFFSALITGTPYKQTLNPKIERAQSTLWAWWETLEPTKERFLAPVPPPVQRRQQREDVALLSSEDLGLSQRWQRVISHMERPGGHLRVELEEDQRAFVQMLHKDLPIAGETPAAVEDLVLRYIEKVVQEIL